MTEPTDSPADECPEVGAVYNYEGQNFAVTRVDPGNFLTFADDEWVDAIAFTEHAGERGTGTIEYVMALDLFVESYALGVIEEGADNDDEESPDADNPQPEPKG